MADMKAVVTDLDETIASVAKKFSAISHEEFAARPKPDKWSRKEVLGHLIDSAHSNLRRFVCGQYEKTPPHIIYEQEFWVKANNYHNESPEALISLWVLMNRRIAAVLTAMPESNHDKLCDTGRGEQNLHPIHWLAADYVKHLKHHVNQIIPGSYAITYP
ncbi:MAG: DinB family protein [Cyclobacteriaceae bacterium]|nr:DinB family protein [Cyclobacteriaceae bacterium]